MTQEKKIERVKNALYKVGSAHYFNSKKAAAYFVANGLTEDFELLYRHTDVKGKKRKVFGLDKGKAKAMPHQSYTKPEKDFKVVLPFRVKRKHLERLTALAEKKGLSPADLMDQILEKV